MQRASILSNEKYRGIRMVLSNNNLKLISTNSEQEEAEEEFEIDYTKDNLDIGFNVTYLIDVLNNVSDESIIFSFADANSSCLVTVPNNDRLQIRCDANAHINHVNSKINRKLNKFRKITMAQQTRIYTIHTVLKF